MKKFVTTACLLLTAFLVFAQQKTVNDANAEVRNVKNFQGISVSGGIDLYISSGEEAVAVSAATTEFRDQIKTEVENGVLKIWYDGSRFKDIFKKGGTNMKLKAYVSYKVLNSLKATGGCDINCTDAIKTQKLTMHLTGGCDFKGTVNVESLEVEQSGGCDVKISGTASNVKVRASGGCDFKGFDLTTDVCDVHASGASDIEITANKEVVANATGASDVRYKGTAVVKDIHSSGASSIQHRS